ncbi:MAG: hypothetical protein CTY21_12200 [Methylomonas sp.]|nr:MAG: hypothetical protein CTY21_12200 [Methylomonas sp.]
MFGWQHAGGLWAINTQVRAIIPDENIDAVYLIGERAFYLDDRQGRRTHLELIRRDAFLEGAT